MSLYSALFAGVSGLNSYSSALAAISDNITNVNTVGYKTASTEFQTLVTESAGSNLYSAGGVTSRTRSLVSQQGLLQASASNTDLSIDGSGFFVVKTDPDSANGGVRFTRAGAFRPDAQGRLQNTSGDYLMGWPLNSTGAFINDGDVSRLVPISTAGLTGTAEPTTQAALRANLQSSQESFTGTYAVGDMANGTITPHFQRSLQVFDAQGGSHSLATAFLKSPTNNEWHMEVYASPASDVTEANGLLATGTIAFRADGSLDLGNSSPELFDPITATWSGGASPGEITLDLGSDGGVDGLTQFNSISTLISSTVDGAVFGNVTGVSFSKDGSVTALFDNGLTRAVYKIPVATFQNPDGLNRLQGNAYGTSDYSGTYALVEPGTGGGGVIAPSTLEASTVDLAGEFTKLITTQRAFSASTKVITTADEMLNELNQVKR